MSLQYIYGTRGFIKLEKIVTAFIQNPSRSCFGLATSALLVGFSYLFRIYITLLQLCYQYRIFSVYKSAIPVISIGNITAGGSGKTLFTCFLLSQLPDVRCAIALRGYRSIMGRQRKSTRVIPSMSAKYCGDEALVIAKQFPTSAIFVGKDRTRAALLANEWNAACLILDDGMQHHKIQRDIHVIMMRSDDLFGGNAFLPRGYLREHPKNLKLADLIVIHQASESTFESQVEQLRVYTSAPIIGTQVYISKVVDYCSGEQIEAHSEKVGLFCGIGNPSSFIHTVEKFGYQIIREFCIADHEEWQTTLLKEFAIFCKARGAKRLLCTEKDASRLSILRLALPVGVVCATIQITKNESEFTDFLHRIRSLV